MSEFYKGIMKGLRDVAIMRNKPEIVSKIDSALMGYLPSLDVKDLKYIPKGKDEDRYKEIKLNAGNRITKSKPIEEDLIQSDSDEAFKKNVETELKAGKPRKQALAIAYSVKEKNRMKNLKESFIGKDYNIQSLEEVMEGFIDNMDPEDIDKTIKQFRAIGSKLDKENFESVEVLICDDEYDPVNYSFHGEKFNNRYPDLLYYEAEDLSFIREKVHNDIWLYFRDERAIEAYMDMIDDLNNSLNEKKITKELKTYRCLFDGDEVGIVKARNEEEAYMEMEKQYPEFHYGLYDGVAEVIECKDEILEESNSSKSGIETEIRKAIRDYYSDLEDDDFEDFVNDYLVVEVVPANNNMVKVEVRAELGYDSFMDLIDAKLDPIIQKYDKDAYFEMEDAGIANTFIRKNKLKKIDPSLTESTKSVVDEMAEAGGKEAYIIKLEDELKDLNEYRDWLDTQGIREVGKGGQFDSVEDLNETIKDIESRMDEINNKLTFVRR